MVSKTVSWLVLLALLSLGTIGAAQFDPHSPGPIGDVTPSTGQFTQQTWVGTSSDHSFSNLVLPKSGPSTFCWPKKFWIYSGDRSTIDDILGWGYNCDAVATDNYMVFALEHNWWDGTKHQMEHYMQVRQANSSVTLRPYSFYFNTDSGTELAWRFIIGTTGNSGFQVDDNVFPHFRVLPARVTIDTSRLVLTYAAGNPMIQVTGANRDLNLVVGQNRYTIAHDSHGIFPAVSNTVDLGGLGLPFRNGWFGTQVSTPKLTGITDTTVVTNLNADMVDGHHATDFGLLVNAPASSGSACQVGQWAVDSSFFYVCVARNTWRRTSVSYW